MTSEPPQDQNSGQRMILPLAPQASKKRSASCLLSCLAQLREAQLCETLTSYVGLSYVRLCLAQLCEAQLCETFTSYVGLSYVRLTIYIVAHHGRYVWDSVLLVWCYGCYYASSVSICCLFSAAIFLLFLLSCCCESQSKVRFATAAVVPFPNYAR